MWRKLGAGDIFKGQCEVRVTTNKWLIAISVFTGAVMGTMDTFILYVATPHLRGVFSSTIAEISWVSTSYAAASLVCMLMSVWLCEKVGTKKLYISALVVFMGASILCGTADTLSQLILARIMQGAAAGVLLPIENVILRRSFPKQEHGIALGVYAATIMLGPCLGPLVGGYVLDTFHWSYIFLINIPIGIVGLFLATIFIPPDSAPVTATKRQLDVPGLFLLVVGITTLLWMLERGDRLNWFDDEFNIVLLWVSLLSLALFVAHQLRCAAPLVDFRVLEISGFRTSLILKFMMGFIVSATLFLLPIYMQELLRFSPSKAGASMAPRALVMMFFFPLLGFFVRRLNPQYFLLSGAAIGCYSAFLMSRFTHETGMDDMYWPQILLGMGTALILVPLATLGMMSVSPDRLSSAAGVDAFIRTLGGVLGIAIFATLLSHYQQESWGYFRGEITFSKTELYRRFVRLVELWTNNGSDYYEAVMRSRRMLFGRVVQQVQAVTFMRSFQVTMYVFLIIFLISAFAKFDKKSDSL